MTDRFAATGWVLKYHPLARREVAVFESSQVPVPSSRQDAGHARLRLAHPPGGKVNKKETT